MTLYMIGLGLNDEKDISIKGLETIKRCKKVFLENYTSVLSVKKQKLEEFFNKKIVIADRDLVEKNAEQYILEPAKTENVAFLVVGDPFGATTHIDLRLRAKGLGVDVKVINNASIINAIGITGLELYKFGKITSIPFDNKNVKTPFEVFEQNDKIGLHTLFLLDLDPKKDRFLTIDDALNYLIRLGLDKKRKCVGCTAIGSDAPEIVFLSAENMAGYKFMKYPQCLVIPSKMHFMEEDSLEAFSKDS